MEKEEDKLSGFESLISLALTTFIIIFVSLLSAFVVGYYTGSAGKGEEVFCIGVLIAVIFASHKFQKI